jgi:hypothetical protein
MLLLSLAGGIGVWVIRGPVQAKAAYVFERVEGKLDIADKGLEKVKATLARATERLDGVREEQRQLAREPRNSFLQRKLARTVQSALAPTLGDAHETINTVAEAVVVVNSVLEDVGNLPFLSIAGLEVGDLREINNSLSQVESSAWELTRLFAEGSASGTEDGDRLSRVDRTLKTMRGLIDQYEPKVALVRQHTEQLKTKTLPWITPAAALISFVCFWIALSQVSLLVHARSWWTAAGRSAT